ncbi:MAG TPA: GNAT family N-acetyltransferase [Woeseiaceae bacterium]|nr:GNAT family N-acetyltransferase [Woeseiaceae bacterium]
MPSTALRVTNNSPMLTIRPIRLADADMEADFVRRLSPASKNFRFLGGVRELSPQMLKAFCDVDGYHSMAFIATALEDGEETTVGVSRYAPNANEEAREIAVTVADDWQHRGIGTRLLNTLIEHAREHGVKYLYSVELVDNPLMRQLATDIGMDVSADPDDACQLIYSLAL